MNIYQVRDNQLSSMQSILVCEPLTFDQVFLDGQSSRQLQGWDTLEFGSDWITKVIATPTIYDWDSITQSYLPRPVTPAIPFSQEELFGYQPPQPAVDTSYWNLRGLFKAKQYDEILSMLNLAIETFDPEISCQTWEELLYNRAMILEVLNHPDEALQDYIAVYEYPDPSPWRDLAELHLEITEP